MCTPDTLDKLNSLISQASDTISCDANCQQQRKADQLKQKYLDAQTNLASAPNQLNTAQKNYLVFTQGLGGYNDANESELRAKAQAIADAFEQNFYDQEAAVNTQIDTYDGLRVNFENIFDLTFGEFLTVQAQSQYARDARYRGTYLKKKNTRHRTQALILGFKAHLVRWPPRVCRTSPG